jgi:diaminohydroxyphosphoribosylaminopyrimidine deaminase/5-amino-6-(5-phosphoribosylamino)uracil reductase
MAEKADERFMQRALALAGRGNGKTSPNPMVGAVLVKGGRIIAEGFHSGAGRDHAEIVVLKKAGARARGATLYVNLEPCCHTGRTGPCTEAIIEAGVKRVVFAVKDPDRRVNGRGAARLRWAGVKVTSGVLRSQAALLNEKYLACQVNQRPFVILKMAQTLDGRIATAAGDSKWISEPASLKLAHQLRAEVDGVVVGMGTLRADNPSLTVRLVRGDDPYRIVLSGSLKFPRDCRLLKDNRDGRTIIASTASAIDRFLRRRRYGNMMYWEVAPGRNGFLDPVDFLKKAKGFGLQSLLIEGGGRVATSFLKAGLVDKYVAIIAPKLLGAGIDAVGDLDIRRLSKAVRMTRTTLGASGADIVLTGYPRKVD